MMKPLTGLLGLALLAAACGAPSSSTEPTESVPPVPVAPAGWTSLGSFGGSGGAGFTGMSSIILEGRDVAVHGACAGNGTLVVLVGPANEGDAGARPAAVFPCGGVGTVADNRFELTGLPIPEVATIRATVIEGQGSMRHAAYNVSVEQGQR